MGMVILFFALTLLSTFISPLFSGLRVSRIEDIPKVWTEYINKANVKGLKESYYDYVLYFGELKKQDYVIGKYLNLVKQGYYQEVKGSVKVIRLSELEYRIEFTKGYYYRMKYNTVPAYLIVLQEQGEYHIITESDYISDTNLKIDFPFPRKTRKYILEESGRVQLKDYSIDYICKDTTDDDIDWRICIGGISSNYAKNSVEIRSNHKLTVYEGDLNDDGIREIIAEFSPLMGNWYSYEVYAIVNQEIRSIAETYVRGLSTCPWPLIMKKGNKLYILSEDSETCEYKPFFPL